MHRLALVLVLGCGGPPKPAGPPPPPPPPPAPTCEHAVGRMVDMIVADQKKSNPDQAEAAFNASLIQSMTGAMVASCTEDKWSVDLRTCIDGAVTIEASDACKKFLTKEQEEAMGKRMAEAAQKK